jgi:hypothetical protein
VEISIHLYRFPNPPLSSVLPVSCGDVPDRLKRGAGRRADERGVTNRETAQAALGILPGGAMDAGPLKERKTIAQRSAPGSGADRNVLWTFLSKQCRELRRAAARQQALA